MDFYFQDQLRWSYGFDNPNKAAAFLATLLPFVWLFARLAWKLRGRWMRAAALVVGTGVLLAGWWLLFNTLSRGGIVAAFGAFAYIGWREYSVREKTGKQKVVWYLVLLCAVGTLFASTGAAERGFHGVTTEDRSVSNRWPLWKGGLEMASENPRGVGAGNSGAIYMQWYQPLDMTARYRTLVNSYLTFLAEQGFAKFGGASFLVLALWFGTRTAHRNDKTSWGEASAPDSANNFPALHVIATGLRASLIAFGITGLWSTTMEEPRLWVPPILASIGLAAMTMIAFRHRAWVGSIERALAATALLSALLYVTGAWFVSREPLRVAVHSNRSVDLRPRVKGVRRTASILVDEHVVGHDYGKLLRQLSTETGLSLCVRHDADNTLASADLIVATGETVCQIFPVQSQSVILIAPSKIEFESARRLVTAARTVTLLLPDYDEDGRGEFWRRVAAEGGSRTIEIPLEGVGTEVEWAWERVIDTVKGAFPNHEIGQNPGGRQTLL